MAPLLGLLLLQPIVDFFPPGNELALRLIHALIFSIGLGFCWRIAWSLLGRGRALWGGETGGSGW